jgi:hypothetical protein
MLLVLGPARPRARCWANAPPGPGGAGGNCLTGQSISGIRGGGGGGGARPPNPKNEKVHVVKILPPPWGLPGAICWRLTPSNQPVGALDPPAVTSVSAPNTRSLVYGATAVWARGRVPFWVRSPRKGPKWVWVRVGSWRGSDLGSTSGARGRPKERRRGGHTSCDCKAAVFGYLAC